MIQLQTQQLSLLSDTLTAETKLPSWGKIMWNLETVIDNLLEETALNIFEELGTILNSLDIKACHIVGPYNRKKVLSRSPGGNMQTEHGM